MVPEQSVTLAVRAATAFIVCVAVLFLLRLLWILPCIRSQPRPPPRSSAKLLIVLGSGGHTTEMLRLLEPLDFTKRYKQRTYVVSSGDTLSEGKARSFEAKKGADETENNVKLPSLLLCRP